MALVTMHPPSRPSLRLVLVACALLFAVTLPSSFLLATGIHPGAASTGVGGGVSGIAGTDTGPFPRVMSPGLGQTSGTIPVGIGPAAIAYDPSTNEIWVANYDSGNVSVIDPTSETVVASIPVGACPDAIALNPVSGVVYVANRCSENLTMIYAANGTVAGSVPVANLEPVALAYDSASRNLYLAGFSGGTAGGLVMVMNGTTGAVVAEIPDGSDPSTLVYDSQTGNVYVADWVLSNVTVIDGSTNEIVSTIPVGPSPDGLALDPITHEIYVADRGLVVGALNTTGSVSVIDAATEQLVATIGVGNWPQGEAFDSATGDVYVGNVDSENVTVINGSTHRTVGSIAGPIVSPVAAAYDSVSESVYVANFGTTVSFLSSTPSHEIYRVAVSPFENRLPVGGKERLTAYPGCYGGICAAGVTFDWYVLNPLLRPTGTFNNTTDQSVEFTAGTLTGICYIDVNANLNGTVTEDYSAVTIVPGSSGTAETPTLLGLPWADVIVLFVAPIVAAVEIIVLMVRDQKERGGPPNGRQH